MKPTTPLLTLALLLTPSLAALNGHCTPSNILGVCLHTADCRSGGGKVWSGYCPNDPEDIKCCTKDDCYGDNSRCAWVDQCGKPDHTISGYCPGPNNFKCCIKG